MQKKPKLIIEFTEEENFDNVLEQTVALVLDEKKDKDFQKDCQPD